MNKQQYQAQVNARVVEVGLSLLATALSVVFSSYCMKWVLFPKPPGASAAKKRLAKRLNVSERSLQLDDHELVIATKIVSPGELDVQLDDIAGLDDLVESLKGDIELNSVFPYARNNSMLCSNRGVLLYGPPGTGKTMIAKALAHETQAILINITASSIFSKWLGDSNKTTQAIFTLANKLAGLGFMSIVFVDEVDALLGETSFEHDSARQVKTEFMQLWDGLLSTRGVMVVGATNRPQSLSDAIWRRFSHHFEVPLPTFDTRKGIFEKKLVAMQKELSRVLALPVTGVLNAECLDHDARTTVVPDAAGVTAPSVANLFKVCPALSEAQVGEHLSTPASPLDRLASLSEGYTGSDIVEVCRRAVRRATLLASGALAGGAARVGLNNAFRPINEVDMLLALCEVKAAANTTRDNYDGQSHSRNASRYARRVPQPAPEAGNSSESIEFDPATMLSLTDPMTLRALASMMEHIRGAT